MNLHSLLPPSSRTGAPARRPVAGRRLGLALACAAALLAGPAVAHDNSLQPRHGGVVAEARDHELELVVQPQRLKLHVRDHGRAVAPRDAHARLTWLADGRSQQVELQPAGDRFEAMGRFALGPGTKAVAIVNLPGQPPLSARFVLR